MCCDRRSHRQCSAAFAGTSPSTISISRRVCAQRTRPHRVPDGYRIVRTGAWPATMATSGVFCDPGGQGLPRDAKDAADPSHTRPFLIGPKDFFTTDLAILAFRGQHPDGPTVFTQILLTATPVMAVFHNVVTAACAARLVHGGCDHVAICSRVCIKEQENMCIIYKIPVPISV